MTPLDLTPEQIIRPGSAVVLRRLEAAVLHEARAAREAKRLRALRGRFL